MPLTPVIVNQMKPGAYYITSGILDVKEEEVKVAVLQRDFRLSRSHIRGEWVSHHRTEEVNDVSFFL